MRQGEVGASSPRRNWFAPNAPDGYRPASDETALQGTDLTADDLTWGGGPWMPVLEPVTDLVPNYEVLGYQAAEIIWGAGKKE